MTEHRDYVEATPDDISQHEAFCRPGNHDRARALLDANGEIGARLRESNTVTTSDLIVVDQEVVDRAREEALAEMATSLFAPGQYEQDRLAWRTSYAFGAGLAKPDFRITTTA